MAAVYIVDTNAIVAALISAQAQSSTARILNGMLKAEFTYAVSQALLNEYYGVLNRAPLRKLHSLTTDGIDTLLTEIAQHAILLNPNNGAINAPDAGDQFLWDLLQAHNDLILVTGDKLLLNAPDMVSRVITVNAFVAGL